MFLFFYLYFYLKIHENTTRKIKNIKIYEHEITQIVNRSCLSLILIYTKHKTHHCKVYERLQSLLLLVSLHQIFLLLISHPFTYICLLLFTHPSTNPLTSSFLIFLLRFRLQILFTRLLFVIFM